MPHKPSEHCIIYFSVLFSPHHLKILVSLHRWLQRKELGFSIKMLPSDISTLQPKQTLLRLLWAASLHIATHQAQGTAKGAAEGSAKGAADAEDLLAAAEAAKGAKGAATAAGTAGAAAGEATERDSRPPRGAHHLWADHEVTYAAAKMSAGTLTAALTAQLGLGGKSSLGDAQGDAGRGDGS